MDREINAEVINILRHIKLNNDIYADFMKIGDKLSSFDFCYTTDAKNGDYFFDQWEGAILKHNHIFLNNDMEPGREYYLDLFKDDNVKNYKMVKDHPNTAIHVDYYKDNYSIRFCNLKDVKSCIKDTINMLRYNVIFAQC